MEERLFGDAGSRVVLEECLVGPEVSFFAICDGRRAVPLVSAQDHKRAFDGDEGPNTGGMGAFAPSPLVDEAMQAQIMREVVDPVVAGLRADGHEYRGFLYAGLMLTCDGPKVIEFNVRFGDPEAQVVIPMIAEELAPAPRGCRRGRARDDAPSHSGPSRTSASCSPRAAIPRPGRPGCRFRDCCRPDACRTCSCSTRGRRGAATTSSPPGGRVLTVVGRGATYEDAIERAYAGVSKISFDGMHYRHDIGRKALS